MRIRMTLSLGCFLFASILTYGPVATAVAQSPWQQPVYTTNESVQRPWQRTCDDRPYPCETPCDAKPRPVPEQPTPRPAPEAPEEQFVQRETGFYQAPPRSGAVQGVTRSLGVRLGGIVIPELRLRLPSLELPCCYQTHEGARMMIERAEAPWVSTGVETVRVGGGAVAEGARQRSTDDTDAASRSAPEADCEGAKREYEEKLQELQRKVDDCEQLKRCLQDCLNDYQRKATDAAAQQNDNSAPVKLPNPTPSDSRVTMPRVIQPASFDAEPNSLHPPARLVRLPAVHDPRPLPQP